MERSSILRWIIIAVSIWLMWTYLPKLWGGGNEGTTALQPLPRESVHSPHESYVAPERAHEQVCKIDGDRFTALVGSHGASLKSLELHGSKYSQDGKQIDLVDAPDEENRRPLRFDWRLPPPPRVDANLPYEKQPHVEQYIKEAQVAYDIVDWTIAEQGGKRCVFTYSDERVSLRKTIKTTGRPFELEVEATIQNLAREPKKHQVGAEVVTWRTESEVASTLGRQSPFVTSTECEHDGKTTRKASGDFEPGDFTDAGFEGGWYVQGGAIVFAAVSDFYFAKALMPVEPPAASCKLQIEERWNAGAYPSKSKDPNAGAMYRSRLSYPERELSPDQSASYRVLAYLGPKERDVLASVGGGGHDLSELVDLGFFSIIAKILLQFLVWLHGNVGNWGVAIILMTIVIRTLLFPLTWKSLKSGLAMRRLKPEIDALNQKFKDDPQAKNLATMELWKKHKVNPVGGCLPALFQLPIWWALYTSLNTAVELYHTPFLWFRDLSAPDPFYILPVILGGTMILQQRLMPMQLDPMQQKMMTYVMPLVFTGMMLFMPAGLAVYMLTNAILGILQQLAVEKYWKRTGVPPAATSAALPQATRGTKS